MIPVWVLSVSHYTAMAAAAAMLGLLGWHYYRVLRKDR